MQGYGMTRHWGRAALPLLTSVREQTAMLEAPSLIDLKILKSVSLTDESRAAFLLREGKSCLGRLVVTRIMSKLYRVPQPPRRGCATAQRYHSGAIAFLP
jgi:hypothetical protein